VQTFKDTEDTAEVLLLEPYAVVFDKDPPHSIVGTACARWLVSATSQQLTPNLYDARPVSAPELDCVTDEVLQQLTHLEGIGLDDGQIANLDACAACLNRGLHVREGLLDQLAKVS
jgi:hypothetical protein